MNDSRTPRQGDVPKARTDAPRQRGHGSRGVGLPVWGGSCCTRDDRRLGPDDRRFFYSSFVRPSSNSILWRDGGHFGDAGSAAVRFQDGLGLFSTGKPPYEENQWMVLWARATLEV